MTKHQTILSRALQNGGGTGGRSAAFAQLLSLSGVHPDRRPLVPESADEWSRLIEMTRSQGLRLLLHDPLLALLAEDIRHGAFGIALQAERMQEAGRNLALAAETVRLVAAFEGEGIRVIPFKGAVLSSIAFGTFASRQPGDIDLLVQPAEVEKAAAVLSKLGYMSLLTRGPAWQAGLLAYDCEWEFVSPKKNMAVDLHWNFTTHNFGLTFPVAEIWQRSRRISFCGHSIETFSAEDLILILSVHAVKHYCRRLEWFFTIATLLRTFPELSWPQLLLNARRYGALRHLRVCLILAVELYHAPLPDEVRAEIAHDKKAEELAVLSLRWIITGEFHTLPSAQHRLFVSRTRIGPIAKLCYWWAVIVTPNRDDYRVELPRCLWWSYPALRLVRLSTEMILSKAAPNTKAKQNG